MLSLCGPFVFQVYFCPCCSEALLRLTYFVKKKKKPYGNKFDFTGVDLNLRSFISTGSRYNENMLLVLAGGDPPQKPNAADPF